MSKNSNGILNPNAREAMDKFKMEAAGEVGVNLVCHLVDGFLNLLIRNECPE